ncbi:MAG: hypothetical protein ACKO3N_03515, partial [Verrucomicrobiota bacterium]
MAGPEGGVTVEGPFRQAGSGRMRLRRGVAATDSWNVTGTARLDGALELALADGASLPDPGVMLRLVQAARRGGNFSASSFPPAGDGRAWNTDYDATGLSVQVAVREGSLTPPRLTRAPAPFTGLPGEAVVLSAEAAGTPPLAFEWFRDGVPVPGAVGPVLDLGPLTPGQVAGYRVRVRNLAGTDLSAEAAVRLATARIPASLASRRTVPSVPGDGVRVEVFNGIGGGPAPRNADLAGVAASAELIAPEIDFPRPRSDISVGDNFERFFGTTVVAPASVRGLPARNFILRHTFHLQVDDGSDLNPSTPEIELRLGVGSDDGFLLEVAGLTAGSAGDRPFVFTWMDLIFEAPGLYPVNLLFAANASGSSGLEFHRELPGGDFGLVPQRLLFT